MNIVYSDDAVGRVRRIELATGTVQTVAGIGPGTIGENGPAIATIAGGGAEGSPLAFSASGELLIGDTGTFRLRRLERNGLLTTIGGTGACCLGSRADGIPAILAPLLPAGIHVGSSSAVDVAIALNVRARRAERASVPTWQSEPRLRLRRRRRRDVRGPILPGVGRHARPPGQPLRSRYEQQSDSTRRQAPESSPL